MDITDIIKLAITILTSVITAFLIPYIKSKTTEKQQENIYFWVGIAVSAAEQIFDGSGRGTEKYQYVVDFLKSKNITFDEGKIMALIESAVYEMNVTYNGK